jgi:hypothetical protein
MSPVLEDHEMGLISFDKFFYDTKDHTMKAMDPSRPNDFISIRFDDGAHCLACVGGGLCFWGLSG